jgi:mxaL protein
MIVRLKYWQNLVSVASIVLLLTALLNPVASMQRDLHTYLLVVDITQSMNTVDMKLNGEPVSRIDYARHLLQNAVKNLPCGNRIGLGIFSAENVVLLYSPIEVCSNFEEIQKSIANLEWRMAWRGNSRLRFGVQAAAAAINSLPNPAQVIFLTDGDEAPKLNAINKTDLSQWKGGQGWLIVGIGGDMPSPIPKLDSENRILGYWAYANSIMAPSQVQSEESIGTRDDSIATEEYNRYLSKLDELYLKELSAEIGASYLRGTQPEKLAEAIKNLDVRAQDRMPTSLRTSLLLGSILLILSGYLPHLKVKLTNLFRKA